MLRKSHLYKQRYLHTLAFNCRLVGTIANMIKEKLILKVYTYMQHLLRVQAATLVCVRVCVLRERVTDQPT